MSGLVPTFCVQADLIRPRHRNTLWTLRRSYYLSSPLRGFSGVKTAGEPIRGHSVFEGKLLSSHASSRSEGGAVDRQAGVKPNLRGRQVRCETGPQRRTSREGGSGRPRGRHSASRFG